MVCLTTFNGASGEVGTFAMQIARAFGAEPTGVCSTANLELLRSLGAHRVVDYTKEDFARAWRQYVLIVDVAGTRPFSTCRSGLMREGTCVTTENSPALLLQGAWFALIGEQRMMLLRPRSPQSNDLSLLRELLETGQNKPVIERCFH